MRSDSGASRLRAALRAYDDAVEVAGVVIVAVLAAVAAVVAQCAARESCTSDGRCGSVESRFSSVTCPFVTLPSLAGDLLYGFDFGGAESLLRGPCAPGERVVLSALTGARACAPHHPWPNGFNTEIANPAAETFHEQACGSWIDAGARLGLSAPKLWSFGDSENLRAAIQTAQATRFASSRLDTTDAGKFYQTCVSTSLAGAAAVRASAVAAFAHLRTGLAGADGGEGGALAGAAWLATHACSGVVQLGAGHDGNQWFNVATRGVVFSEGAMASALFVMGEGREAQLRAERANAELKKRATFAPPLTPAEWHEVFEHATGGAVPANSVLSELVPQMNALVQMAREKDGAADYLLGVAAMCALSLDSSLQRGIGTVEASVAVQEVEKLRAALPAAATVL